MRYPSMTIIAIALLISGCCISPSAPETNGSGGTGAVITNLSQHNETSGAANATPGGNGTIIEAPPGPGGDTTPPSGGVARSQADCATLTPTCAACLAKQNCGWCKSSNSCFLGDASGPSVSSCPAAEWTVTEAGCTAPAGGSGCSAQTNCVSCLSGSGCKWCIQGSKCAPASSAESCFGGWLEVTYQCNYASR